jgi:hypothetical protein
MTRKPTALVIAGGWVDNPKDKDRFHPMATSVWYYLRNAAKLERVELIDAETYSADRLGNVIRRAVMKARGPLFLSYHGHGNPVEWRYSNDGHLDYTQISAILAQAKHETLFVNACCYSFAVTNYFESAQVDSKKIGLIAGSGAEHKAYDWHTERRLTLSWHDGLVYPTELVVKAHQREILTEEDVANLRMPSIIEWVPEERQRVRWGAEWDHLFFPRRK